MYDFEGSTMIETSPDRLFNYVADVRHLPEYFPKALSAKAGDGEDVTVVIDADGDPLEISAWYRVDHARRVVQWGVPEYGYQGWLGVNPAASGCELTVNVQKPTSDGSGHRHGGDRFGDDRYGDDDGYDSTEAEIRDTIGSIRRIMSR